MEVSLGQLAIQKTSNNSVKQFGQRMVDDHGKLNDELKQLVSTKGAALPDMSSKHDEKMKEKLMDKNGADFDKAYIKAMVSDHKKDIKAFEKHAEKADDADLKAFINKALPFMKEHLRVAEAIESAIDKAPSQTKANAPAVAEK
jgi:putative membrane protein